MQTGIQTEWAAPQRAQHEVVPQNPPYKTLSCFVPGYQMKTKEFQQSTPIGELAPIGTV